MKPSDRDQISKQVFKLLQKAGPLKTSEIIARVGFAPKAGRPREVMDGILESKPALFQSENQSDIDRRWCLVVHKALGESVSQQTLRKKWILGLKLWWGKEFWNEYVSPQNQPSKQTWRRQENDLASSLGFGDGKGLKTNPSTGSLKLEVVVLAVFQRGGSFAGLPPIRVDEASQAAYKHALAEFSVTYNDEDLEIFWATLKLCKDFGQDFLTPDAKLRTCKRAAEEGIAAGDEQKIKAIVERLWNAYWEVRKAVAPISKVRSR
jgi:hypothetical protein